jgi:Ca2+-binding RTX toxin-like protein
VDAGAAGTDVAIIDDAADSVANDGFLSYSSSTNTTQVKDLGNENPLKFLNFEEMKITLGAGADTFTIGSTNSANLTVNGGAGNDDLRLTATVGTTTLNGGSDLDTFTLGYKTKRVEGIQGKVTLNGDNHTGAGDLVVVDDSLETADSTGEVSDTSVKGLGMATVNYATVERVTINCGSGNDFITNSCKVVKPTINLGAGQNGMVFTGGAGDDSIRFGWQQGTENPQIVMNFNGTPFVTDYVNCSTIRVKAGLGHDTVVMGPSASTHWRAELFGEDGNDTLIGTTFNDKLDGGLGDDSITGREGNDKITGGVGIDWLLETADVNFTLTNTKLTGLGNDKLATMERASLTGGAGNNVINAAAFTLGAVLLDAGAGNDTVTGTASNDTLLGGDGDDVLNGGAGNDTMTGAAGIDLLKGSKGADTLDGGLGIDTLDGGKDGDAILNPDGLDLLINVP